MNLALAMLGSGVLAALVTAVVTGLFSKRKLSAEATEVITKAASGVVERLEHENTRMLGRLSKLERKVARQEAVIAVHTFWDRQVVQMASEAGLTLPPAPPLYPQELDSPA